MTLIYNAGSVASPSSVDSSVPNDQLQSFFYLKKAIIQKQKEMYFTPLASVTHMPKNWGKTIKVHEYLPLLDDRNINDQGIDAAGNIVTGGWAYEVTAKALTATTTTATAASLVAAINAIAGSSIASASGNTLTLTKLDITKPTGYATQTEINTLKTQLAAEGVEDNFVISARLGNLYGSSKDIGSITGRLPTLSETGGRKNRVGFTRITRQATLQRFGFFYEFTDESLDFDSDAGLKDHLARELMNGAMEIYEDVLQKDLLNAAETIVYSGAATSKATISGESGALSRVTYANLLKLDQLLTENRTPKQTTVITGSRNIDTRTIPASRILYIGTELMGTIKGMKDGTVPVFIGVQHYAGQTTPLPGEIGSIDNFRIVLVPEMEHWAGAGANVTTNTDSSRVGVNAANTGNAYNVYPLLCVGEDSFTTVGFNANNGKAGKFNVITKMPGANSAEAYNNPYGTVGFSSIQWYYATLIMRPERIGLIMSTAPN